VRVEAAPVRGHLLVTTGVVLALAITHAGCSSKDDPAPASDGGTSTSSSGTPGDGGVACIDTNDIDSCSTCCGKQHVEANDKLTSIVLKCMCQDTNCKEACKDSLCGSTDPNYDEA